MAEQLDRFRSFAERYVIARAPLFQVGREQEQAWLALQDAKVAYGMIARAAVEAEPPMMATGGIAGASGVTGPNGFDVFVPPAMQGPGQQPPWANPNAARNAAKGSGAANPPPTIGIKLSPRYAGDGWMQHLMQRMKGQTNGKA